MSIYQLLFAGTTPIGGTFVGLLADKRGVGQAIFAAAALSVVGLLAGILYLRFGPRAAAGPTEDSPGPSPAPTAGADVPTAPAS